MSEKNNSQCRMILLIMDIHGSITQQDAYKFGCARLPARIHDLRKAGFPIGKKMETGKNQFGHTTNYARYFLEVNNG